MINLKNKLLNIYYHSYINNKLVFGLLQLVLPLMIGNIYQLGSVNDPLINSVALCTSSLDSAENLVLNSRLEVSPVGVINLELTIEDYKEINEVLSSINVKFRNYPELNKMLVDSTQNLTLDNLFKNLKEVILSQIKEQGISDKNLIDYWNLLKEFTPGLVNKGLGANCISWALCIKTYFMAKEQRTLENDILLANILIKLWQ